MRVQCSELTQVICTTWPVVVATGASVVFLQLCILTTCILCIYTSRYHHRLYTLFMYTFWYTPLCTVQCTVEYIILTVQYTLQYILSSLQCTIHSTQPVEPPLQEEQAAPGGEVHV